MMPGTGLSCEAKKQLKMAAMSAAVAPLLQAVPIQNAQQAAMARPAAAADSSAMPWSRCSGGAARPVARRASRGAVQPGADLAPQRQAFVIAVDQLAQPGHQAGQQRVAPAGAAVDGRRQPDGGARSRSAVAWVARGPASIHLKCWPAGA